MPIKKRVAGWRGGRGVESQNKKKGEEKDEFKDGGVGEGGKQHKNEDEQNDWLEHLGSGTGGCE